MKRIKFLLLAALLVATAGAFAGNLKADCASGPLFYYTGSNPDPASDPSGFLSASDKNNCDLSSGVCTWYHDGENYIPCPENPSGVYIP